VADRINITAPERYLRVLRADGSQLSRHLTVEDAIESAANAPPGEYRIVYPDRIVKAYGVLPSTPVPAAPTDLVVIESTAGYVSLTWSDDGNGTSWTMYRDGTPIGSVSSQSYTDTNVAPSTLYSYQVQASNSGGTSAISAAYEVTTPANSAPAWGLTPQSLYIGQSYNLALNSVCTDIDAQPLTFSVTSGSVPGLSHTGSNFSGTPTTVGVYPVVFSANDGYTSALSGTVNFTVSDPDVTAPTVPGDVAAAANGATATVSWTASTDASGVANYRVYRDGALRGAVAGLTYEDADLPAGTYTYSVSAVDASFNANESAQAMAAPISIVPDVVNPPTGLTVLPASATSLLVSWSAPAGGLAPTGYEVEKSDDNATWSAVAQYTSPSLSFTNTGLTTGVRRYYRVRSVNGSLTSAWTTGSGVPEESPTATTFANVVDASTGFELDVTRYVNGSLTNGWRSNGDTVLGWDWSFPAQVPPKLSGMWHFSNGTPTGNWPAGFPGKKLFKINLDWRDVENATEGVRDFSDLDAIEQLADGWDGVQLDVRGSVYESTDASLLSAPTWLANETWPAGSRNVNVSTSGGNTISYYDISYSTYYTPFRAFITALAAYKPRKADGTVNDGNYTVPEHPNLTGQLIHGISSSEGEEAGTGDFPQNTVETIQHMVAAYGAVGAPKLCWVGEGRDWADVNEAVIVDGGVGCRGGLLERFARRSFTPYETDTDAATGDEVPGTYTNTGQVFEQYKTAPPNSVNVARNAYLTVDEDFPPIAGLRYYQDQMEEFTSDVLTLANKDWDTLEMWQLQYRMCLLRGLQMRRNNLAVEPKSTTLLNGTRVKGIEGFVNPPLIKWASVQLGRRIYSASEADQNCEANEAFCLLSRFRAKSEFIVGRPGDANFSRLPNGTNYVHNLERWLTQREADGATTPALQRDLKFSPSTDPSAYVTELGLVDVARTGTVIGFRLDDRMRFGSSIAVKVTYLDRNSEEWTLRYTTSTGLKSAASSPKRQNEGGSVVRTTTFFITDFSNIAGVNFQIESGGNTPFMFVRVIKV
jgi:hypothetical protein